MKISDGTFSLCDTCSKSLSCHSVDSHCHLRLMYKLEACNHYRICRRPNTLPIQTEWMYLNNLRIPFQRPVQGPRL